MIALHNQDCLEFMKTLPDNSIDAVVTDPPYGMSNHTQQDIINCLSAWLAGKEYKHSKAGFMGKEWDSFVPSPNIWKEVFRVLKPGGHILCAASSRTVDLMGISLRLAGFEIRDTVEWIYGSGFPKSLDISKAIDKAALVDCKKCKSTGWILPINNDQVKRIAINEGFTEIQVILAYQVECPCCHGKGKVKGAEREVVGQYNDNNRKCSKHQNTHAKWNGDSVVSITAPTTEAAKQYSGFGTALKPAHEPFILARKPIEKGLTIAENCLKWGTGGLSIDDCRVNLSEDDNDLARVNKKDNGLFGIGNNNNNNAQQRKENGLPPVGRFPANLILDDSDCVRALFPDTKPSRQNKESDNRYQLCKGKMFNVSFAAGDHSPNNSHDDNGGSAARFFYCAKASPSERNRGLEGFEFVRNADRIKDDGVGGENPRNRTNQAKVNHHPTVKPLNLMLYLIKLISKEDDIILDPFAGSGTTGVACKKLNRRFVGCELHEPYFQIASARIENTPAFNSPIIRWN
jgi:site-specific DNA-methyltransferase (adenine-specific)